MFKKWSIIVLLFVFIMSVSGCGNGDSSEKASAGSSKLIKTSIESASYILTGEDDGVSENQESGLLLVNFKVKNVSDSSVNISAFDGIKLYDGEEEFNPKTDVYNSDLDLDPDARGSIGANKVKTVSAFFEVEKDKKYEIGITPSPSDFNEEAEEVILKLDTKKYAKSFDTLEDPAKALAAYIDTIYLEKENSDYEKYVSADKAALQGEAKAAFKDILKRTVYNDVLDTEVDKHYTSYKSVLAEKAEIKTKTKANANGKAVVVVEYSTVPLTDLHQKIFDYQKEYREKSGNYDSKKAQQYALTKFDGIINSLEVQSGNDNMEIKMTQKDGKWTVDTSDYASEDLVDVFAAGSR